MIEYLKRFRAPYIRIICFCVILFVLAYHAQYYLQYRERYNDNSSFQVIDFYKEEKNSADAVFIGSSCCFSFYSPLFAYESYGIRTLNYSSSGMGMMAYRYAIEEVRKTQKEVPIILTITPNYQMEYLGVHFMSDYMPMSGNKIAFLSRYFTQDGESILNSIGFYATIMEYHDRWVEMEPDDFIIDEGIKGATRHKYYLSTINDITEQYLLSAEKEEMPDQMAYLMNDLLDYCDEKKENIIFLLPPRVYSAEQYRQLNTLADLISDRGYDLLDLRDKLEEIGLHTDRDFYDVSHTNIHGSIKYTDYLLNYLKQHYELHSVEDQGWDKAVEKYHTIIDPYVLDIETDMTKRDYFLDRPELLSLVKENDSNILNWQNVQEADGYVVYRKTDSGFEKVYETGDTSFKDEEVNADMNYTYTVIAYKLENGERVYGDYDYAGLSLKEGQ
ncbi:MAG: hypothetical protein IJI46_05145 [Erysipelotrichaceae bacterium]|nr:hypothetical protein [Erysipelotrichaceae bacterium]